MRRSRIRPVVHATFCACIECERRRHREKLAAEVEKELRAYRDLARLGIGVLAAEKEKGGENGNGD